MSHPTPPPDTFETAGRSAPLSRPTLWAVLSGLAVTILAAALLLGASLRGPWDGIYLFRDFVTVPEPVFGENLLGGTGAPRAVPLDAVVAALSAALPAGLVARVLLISPLLLVGSGMTVLLRRFGPVATSVGAGLAITNPYVAERLLLGQSPSLLGYAMIPWLVVAVRAVRPLPTRVLLVLTAALPAALTPVGAVTAGITVLVVALALGPAPSEGTDRPPLGGRALEGLALLAPIALLSLPWILAGLQHPSAGAAPEGADAFAVRSDSFLAVAGSVATLGGVWADGAWPASRNNGFVTVLSLALVLGAAGAWHALRSRIPLATPSTGRTAGPNRAAVDLAAAGYVAPVIAVLALAGPLLPIWRWLQQVPGLALLRDTHRLLGWAALGVAVLVAVGMARALRHLDTRRTAAAGLTVTVLAAGVLTAPDVPGRLARDLHPVAVPAEWEQVVSVVNEGPPGSVLLLPWQPFRQVSWAGPVQFLDPLPRALEPEVVHARDLLVRRGYQEWWVGGEDPEIGAEVRDAAGVLDADLLHAEGISRVVIWLDSPGELPQEGEGLHLAHGGEHWLVLEVSDSSHSP